MNGNVTRKRLVNPEAQAKFRRGFSDAPTLRVYCHRLKISEETARCILNNDPISRPMAMHVEEALGCARDPEAVEEQTIKRVIAMLKQKQDALACVHRCEDEYDLLGSIKRELERGEWRKAGAA